MKKSLLFFLSVFSCLALGARTPSLSSIDHIDLQYGIRSLQLKQTSLSTDYFAGTQQAVYASANLPGLQIQVTRTVFYSCGKPLREYRVEITSGMKLTEDLTVRFPLLSLQNATQALMPRKDGTVFNWEVSNPQIASYRCAGKQEMFKNDLALPLLIVSPAEGATTAVLTDPFFSTAYEKGYVSWCYPKEVGLEEAVERRTILEAEGICGIDEGMELYYATILKDLPPGPEWIHRIAMVGYDYFSDGGRGWYNDIDTLCTLTSFEERAQIALCLHGWYDAVGRYTFNESTGRLDPIWTNQLRNMEVTLEDLHRRLAYAKERGFMVLLYFADGIVSSKGLPDYSESETYTYSEGYWNGPDALGGTYLRNLGFERHVDFYRNYARALFTEFGADVDGFVWDETYYIPANNTGTDHKRAYLPRIQMRLVKEITAMLHDIAPGKAFFVSDITSVTYDTPPYALFADGTYQDSRCDPALWPGGLFSNYRNAIWSCNWYPHRYFNRTAFSAITFHTPVAISNGWGEDRGMSEMSQEEVNRVMKLFRYRKQFNTRPRYFETLPSPY